ncbi:hypothetical protein DIPPA_21099 [Diplonema papillatum]|nr:hypothetical protein DIPPA_21099 [Diplonema papillatum]
MADQGYVKVPVSGRRREDGASTRTRRRTASGSKSPKKKSSSKRRRREGGSSGGGRRRRRRSSSDTSSRTTDLSSTTKAVSQPAVAFPSFDPRDEAPEDRMVGGKPAHFMGQQRGPLDPRVPLVRGSLRLEGVNYAKYESFKADPERQRMFTTALRDDLISETGNGVVREDILLRVTPGPIKTVVLDYNSEARKDGQPGPPSLADAEWCIDCEYAIAARDEERQIAIAHTLFEVLSSGDLNMSMTKKAYVRYLNPDHADPGKIKVVPASAAADLRPVEPFRAPRHRNGVYEEDDPLEGRFTWHHRRTGHDLAKIRTLPDMPRGPSPPHVAGALRRDNASIGGMLLEHRPVPDPAQTTSHAWWDSRQTYDPRATTAYMPNDIR